LRGIVLAAVAHFKKLDENKEQVRYVCGIELVKMDLELILAKEDHRIVGDSTYTSRKATAKP
jgi:hypothetical protein